MSQFTHASTTPSATSATTPAATVAPIPTVMERLRDSTAENHQQAERHPLQAALATGTLSRQHFALQHAQLYLVHRALETQLILKAAGVPAIARVVKLYQISAPYLAADLRVLGLDPASVTPTPGTKAIIERINSLAANDPIALLGMQYVLEGSKNGAKFLCRVAMKAYSLAPGQGCLYMDPYADKQREYWQQFKTDMNAIEFTEAQTLAMIEAAKSMFDAIAAIGSDVLAR